MPETPESSSPSTTTPDPTDEGGVIFLGGKKIATKAQWEMHRERDYIDATAFGEKNKTYLVGLKDYSGSFSGRLEHGDLFVPITQEQELNLWAQARPAWWGRLKHRLLKTPWPEYLVSSGRVRGDVEPQVDEDEVSWSFGYVGPVTIYSQPQSKLERIWSRFCWRMKHPLFDW